MPPSPRSVVAVLCILFFSVAIYYRVRSQTTREPLDRTREGWPILIGCRLAGLALLVATVAAFYRPAWHTVVAIDLPVEVRWTGVCVSACALAWLLWMFRSLGRNLTDTVVTRRDSTFVCHGPYRYVRNPMYTGVFTLGVGLGIALGSWLVPLASAAVFTLLAIRTTTEEKFLIDRFGDQYRDYMRRVPRFVPRLKPSEHRRAAGI